MASATCEAPFEMWGDDCVLPVEERFNIVFETIIGMLLLLLVGSGIFQCIQRMQVVKKIYQEMYVAKKVCQDLGKAMEDGNWKKVTKVETVDDDQSDDDDAFAPQEKIRKKSLPSIASGKAHWLSVTSGLSSHIRKVHKDFIIGIGLPTFYNQHALPACTAIFAMYAFRGFPVLEKDTDEDVVEYASLMFWALTKMYVMLMVFAMCFARMQRIYATWFHSQNIVMHDYCAALKDLPETMTNENDLLHCLHQHGFEQRFVGVSIAYDYSDYIDEINEMWEHNLIMQDKIYKQKQKQPNQPVELSKSFLEKDEEYKKKFQELFPKLKGSGYAFVVLQSLGQTLKLKQSWKGFWLKQPIKCSNEEEKNILRDTIEKAKVKQSAMAKEPWSVLDDDLAVGKVTIPKESRIRCIPPESKISSRVLFHAETSSPEVRKVKLNEKEAGHRQIKDILMPRGRTECQLSSSFVRTTLNQNYEWKELPHSLHLPQQFLEKSTHIRLHEEEKHFEYKTNVKQFLHVAVPDLDENEKRSREEIEEEYHDEARRKSRVTEEPWKMLKSQVRTPCGTVLRKGSRVRPVPVDVGVDFECESFVTILAENNQEPPSILWENCGNSSAVKSRLKILKSTCLTALTFGLIFLLVLRPYKNHINDPYLHEGRSPKAVTTQIFGAIVGIFNNILGAVMWQGLWGAGFMNWMTLDLHCYHYNVFMSAFNNLFNIAQSIRTMPVLWTVHDDPDYVKQCLANEEYISSRYFEMLVPGWLFSGFFIGQTIGIVLPFVQNLFFLNVIFVWQWFPSWVNKLLTLAVPTNPNPTKPLSKRQAELIFTPGTLGVSWDFGNLVLTPSLACMMLLVYTNRPGKIFPWVLGYTVMIYWWHRLVTLKLRTKEMLSGLALDHAALRMWGLMPLSLVAGAIGLWGYRLGYWKSIGIVGMIAFHVVLFLFGLDKFGHDLLPPQVQEEKTYGEACLTTKYNFFNVNPIHVLKSRYLPEHLPSMSEAHIPFVYGKEYLLNRESTKYLEKPRDCAAWKEFCCWCPSSMLAHARRAFNKDDDEVDTMTEALLGADGDRSRASTEF